MTLPPQGTRYWVVVFGAAGFATVDSDTLIQQHGILTIKPWAHVRGTLMIGSHPAAVGETVSIDPEDFTAADGASIPHVNYSLSTKTDGEDRFVFDRVPPMRVMIARQIFIDEGGGFGSAPWLQGQYHTLQPDQSLEETIGGQGRAVVGHVDTSAALAARNDWYFGSMSMLWIKTDWPAPPDAIKSDPIKSAEWQKEFAKSDDYRKFRERSQAQCYCPQIQRNGDFRIEDVAAGNYKLAVSVLSNVGAAKSHWGREIASGGADVTVPPVPSGRDSTPLFIREIKLTEEKLPATAPSPN